MKKIIYLIVICSMHLFVSCNDDILERTPLDEISEPEFWKTVSDLELYSNSFYQDLPGWQGVSVGNSPNPDNGTDVSMATGFNSRLNGQTGVPTNASTSIWNWSKVRKANYFVSNAAKAEGLEIDLNQYIGEGYFFRAYYYFDLLKDYGALPIYDAYFTNTDREALFRAREPRNKVADFILADLDKAIAVLKPKSAVGARVSKEAAQLLKATVALYEGTWEKYHNGTVFGVAGSTGTTYLQQAADASKALIDGNTRSLHSSYGNLFNQTNLTTNTEVILWRQYDFLGLGSTFGNALQLSWPNASSYTRFAIRSYLCNDGKPIGVSTSLYQGDQSLNTIETNRDPRLAATVMVPGDIVSTAVNGTNTLFVRPLLNTNVGSVGGYESQKYRVPQIVASSNSQTRDTAKILMRYAEALLIYAEAKAELGTITQADLDLSINKLRSRTGVAMPALTLAVGFTDPNWPDYGYSITPLLQEIRRERMVELMGEGFRLDDLMRWRAHKLFAADTSVEKNRPRGAYYETGKGWATGQKLDANGYLDPYQESLPNGYLFNLERDYLLAIPQLELTLNPNLLPQNPGYDGL
ncbi:RagB/SusD family nutrient uptake outer membrane protein [Mariniflexile gromovii]|uniref:RagB/SusD family nutrient uptake outer membrane protein n=1 Tax=Mariniflexile gromovii TaxID=362523 RepID=A0ABS4BRA9_9FLAO|nr:RagB/SusD family nutrient uptake outer membrane protein [Mariniflexile gromovii]MBP0902953.1 RagB/SusD family nutrient uptake outer membrane protein [Mariniflexile gromovii]